MKSIEIIKGNVKKEEEAELKFSSRTLNQVDIRLRNEGSKYTAELIRDVVSYNPAKPNEAQLRDDFRIVCAWYSSIKQGKKFKLMLQDVIALAKKIYIEIEERKREGKMKHEWNPENMKEHSRELFDIVSKDKPPQTSRVTNENDEASSKVSDDFKKGSTSSLDPPDDIIKDKEEETLPIYPGGTSDKYEPLELTEFLDKWNSFVIRKPFISLVGSLANWNRTEGDIDILVKARDPTPLLEALDRAIVKCFEIKEEQMADLLIQVHQFIHTDSLFLNSKWRIERAFPEWKGRISVLDDSFSGPFTNFVELADLVSLAREDKVRQEMSEKKLKLFQWFPMLKPLHGRSKSEMYSIDSVIETIKSRKEDWFAISIYVEKKFDGCVPYSTLIDTDRGRIPIGVIVNSHLPIKVLSFNHKTSRLEFKSIKTYWKNSTQTNWLKIVAGRHILKCTPDHEVFSSRGKLQAANLRVNDFVFLPVHNLDFNQEQVLIGTCLGDSSLIKNEGPNTTPRLRLAHSLKQYVYASFKAEVLSNLDFSEEPYKSGFGSDCIRFQSKTSSSLSALFPEFSFSDGKRFISDFLLSKITPLALAVWHCDDGTIHLSDKQRPRIYLYLNRYPLESVQRVKDFFKSKFDLHSTIHEWKGYFLTFSADSTEKFIRLVKDFVHPSMAFKLNMKSEQVGSKLNFLIGASALVSHKIEIIAEIKTHSLHRYNLEVEDNHNYFAGGMLVGNCHIQMHKEGDRVKLITEDGTDITKNCPTVVKELAAKSGDFILCGEMELWKKNKHQPRAETAGILNTKETHPDEKDLRFNVFDCLYYKR